MSNTPTLTQYEESIAPWNEPISELYDWVEEGDYEPDILDHDD